MLWRCTKKDNFYGLHAIPKDNFALRNCLVMDPLTTLQCITLSNYIVTQFIVLLCTTDKIICKCVSILQVCSVFCVHVLQVGGIIILKWDRVGVGVGDNKCCKYTMPCSYFVFVKVVKHIAFHWSQATITS